MKTETICFGDCLEHLKRWVNWNKSLTDLLPSKADLIYLDPPWNSGRNYNILFGKAEAADDETQAAQETAFKDMWQWDDRTAGVLVQRITNPKQNDWEYHDHAAKKSIFALKHLLGETGMLAYCAYMADRLRLLHAILAPTGSLYLHCDPHASHYLKIIMDDIFGPENYRNEITWKRQTNSGAKARSTRKFGSMTDIIFFYAKSEKAKIRKLYLPVDDEYLKRVFRMKDEKGNFKVEEIQEASQAKLEEYEREGLLYKSRTGKLGKKKYDWQFPGILIGNLWTDFMALGSNSKERTGYATQKPLKLLRRIIEASTDEGDVVLDPFCGCGTAVVAARQLKRKFVGIDISLYATETVAYNRLKDEAKMKDEEIRVDGFPMDERSAKRLAKDDPFAFEMFAVEACMPGMVANKSQRRDRGIDGRGWLLHPVIENGKKKHLILAQVKAGKPTLSQVRDFANVIQNTVGAVAGVFITVEKIGREGDGTEEMRRVAAQLGTFQHPLSMEEFPRMQFWHIKQFYYYSKRQRLPDLPELADPNKEEKVPIRQTGFLTKMRRYSHG